jgi:cytochrome d ubiquinol oxidase subunit I
MIDFGALLFNPHAWVQFPHVIAAGITTAAFFVLGISAYHLLKKAQDLDLFRRSFRMAVVYATVGTLLVALIGHTQGQYMIRVQPMKMAAAEAVWESEDPASLSLFSIISQQQHRNLFSIEVPYLLSVLAYNRLTGEVMGLNELQAQYEAQYGPGNYMPPVAVCYWAFRTMVGMGILMPLLALLGLFLVLKERQEQQRWFLRLLPWAIFLPYVANTAGWLLTEMGRQPWMVYGLLKTEAGVSPNVGMGTVVLSLVLFATVYAALMATDIYLLVRAARQGAAASDESSAAAY